MTEITISGYVENYIVCPYCKSYDADRRIGVYAVCNECNHIFHSQCREFYKTREITDTELGELHNDIALLRKSGRVVANAPKAKISKSLSTKESRDFWGVS